MEESVKIIANDLRARLLDIEREVRRLPKNHEFEGEQAYVGQHHEMLAQAELALRAVEEARMRLGKVLQYGRDGKSIYDTNEAP